MNALGASRENYCEAHYHDMELVPHPICYYLFYGSSLTMAQESWTAGVLSEGRNHCVWAFGSDGHRVYTEHDVRMGQSWFEPYVIVGD